MEKFYLSGKRLSHFIFQMVVLCLGGLVFNGLIFGMEVVHEKGSVIRHDHSLDSRKNSRDRVFPTGSGQSSGGRWHAKSQRTPPQQVGAVMAILATFDEVRVLPPESSPQANHLIRALIQFQSLFMNRTLELTQHYLTEAFLLKFGQESSDEYANFVMNGWTSKALEALVDYSNQHAMEDNPEMLEAFHQYNLSPNDWNLVVKVFIQARQEFLKGGEDIHNSFGSHRGKMPGG